MKTRLTSIFVMVLSFLITVCEAQAKKDKADGEKTEVKFIVQEKDIDRVKTSLNLRDGDASRESDCFYETANRDLNAQKLILRSRYLEKDKAGKVSAADDKDGGTTVKLRTAGQLDRENEKKWIKAIDGDSKVGKIEKDQIVGKAAVESLSLNNPQKGSEIVKVENATRDVSKIFSPLQEDFIAARFALAWEKLKRVGPIKTFVWKKVAVSGLGDCEAEEWILNKASQPQKRLLEISKKVVGDTAADAFAKQLEDFMKTNGFLQDPKAETKTRIAFNYFLGNQVPAK